MNVTGENQLAGMIAKNAPKISFAKSREAFSWNRSYKRTEPRVLSPNCAGVSAWTELDKLGCKHRQSWDAASLRMLRRGSITTLRFAVDWLVLGPGGLDVSETLQHRLWLPRIEIVRGVWFHRFSSGWGRRVESEVKKILRKSERQWNHSTSEFERVTYEVSKIWAPRFDVDTEVCCSRQITATKLIPREVANGEEKQRERLEILEVQLCPTN